MDKISIIVPIYNVEKYIRRCIDSLIQQSYPYIEIILIDDGSTDNCGAICDEYNSTNPNIVVVHKPNGGLGYARNSGLDIASGDYVAFVDGDDYIGKDYLKNMYEMLKKTGADTCMSGYTKKYDNHEQLHPHVLSDQVYTDKPIIDILPKMCGFDENGADHIEMSVCMVLFSNKIIKENNLRFESEEDFISEDLVFDFLYYPFSKGVCMVDQCSYYYCDNEGSLTTKYRSDRFDAQVNLYNYILVLSERIGIIDSVKPRMDSTLLAIARYSIKLECKFARDNGWKNADTNIKKICNNECLENVFLTYNGSRIKITSRCVNFLIKNKTYSLIKLIMGIKNAFNI